MRFTLSLIGSSTSSSLENPCHPCVGTILPDHLAHAVQFGGGNQAVGGKLAHGGVLIVGRNQGISVRKPNRSHWLRVRYLPHESSIAIVFRDSIVILLRHDHPAIRQDIDPAPGSTKPDRKVRNFIAVGIE